MPTPSAVAARAGRFTARLEQRDDYGIVLLLILATIVTISLGQGAGGQFIGVCLSGFTLLFVLHTSDAPRRTYRAASVIVGLAVAGAALSLLIGYGHGAAAAGLIGLLLAFAAPLVILRRITRSPTITVRLVLGALAIYLLLGLTFSYLYPLIQFITGEPFFVQTSTLRDADDGGVRRLHGVHERRTDDRRFRGTRRSALPGISGGPARGEHRSDDGPRHAHDRP